jgi:hypothetical protein
MNAAIRLEFSMRGCILMIGVPGGISSDTVPCFNRQKVSSYIDFDT